MYCEASVFLGSLALGSSLRPRPTEPARRVISAGLLPRAEWSREVGGQEAGGKAGTPAGPRHSGSSLLASSLGRGLYVQEHHKTRRRILWEPCAPQDVGRRPAGACS